MANIIQRFIYNISTVAPICFVFSVTWYLQKKTIVIPLISAAIGTILIILFGMSFYYGKKHLSSIAINVTGITPYDGWIAVYMISYILPFASMAIQDFSLLLCSFIGIGLALIAPYINTAIPHPLLFCRLYHFYQISTENGVSGYILISKRDLRNSRDIKTIMRAFEFLLMDTKGM